VKSLATMGMMSATGCFDHCVIDGSDGTQLMKAFRELFESPLGLVA
jgi:pyruvate dehydrogenase E2 component (dihydrolipoamide acetyltransferase)